ncbi:MAG: NEW3 domain-containing protein [Candidatus Nanohaloarchaea archaeon]
MQGSSKQSLVALPLVAVFLLLPAGLGITADNSTSATIGINITSSCSVAVYNSEAPGSTSTDPSIIALGQSDWVSGWIVNYANNRGSGNYTNYTHVSVDTVITYEAEDRWQEGEPVGDPINLSLQGTDYSVNYSIPEYEGTGLIYNSSRLYAKNFTAYTDYRSGNYTARLRMNYSCFGRNETYHVEDFDNFVILPSKGHSGGVNLANNTGSPTPEDINDTGALNNATIANQTGNQPSDVESPADVESRNTSAEPEPGDAPNPGQTEVPNPVPEPMPRLQIDIEPFKDQYIAARGQYTPVSLQVQNLGNSTIESFQITPSIGELRQGWQVRSAQVSSIGPGANITRKVFVRPPENAEPGMYVSPVIAGNSSVRYDLDYFTVKVPREPVFTSRISIQEAPGSVSFQTNTTRRIPVLVKNTGEKPLTDVTVRLQNAEDCAITRSSTVDRIPVNGSASLSVTVETVDGSTSCDTQLIVSSSEGAYAFSDLQFSVRPESGLIPRQQRVPFLAIIWTVVLGVYAVVKKRYGLDSGIVKAPLVLLLTGESVILIYLVVNYYGIVSVGFLPF